MKSLTESSAKWGGGYGFIASLAGFLSAWIIWNKLPWFPHFDDPQLVMLNLMLSIEASFAMPVLLMAQNRQGQEDRSLILRFERCRSPDIRASGRAHGWRRPGSKQGGANPANCRRLRP
jgi:uncharacterized protein DUF1003